MPTETEVAEGRELDTLVHSIVFGGVVCDRAQAIRLSNETENGKRVPFDNWYAGDF